MRISDRMHHQKVLVLMLSWSEYVTAMVNSYLFFI